MDLLIPADDKLTKLSIKDEASGTVIEVEVIDIHDMLSQARDYCQTQSRPVEDWPLFFQPLFRDKYGLSLRSKAVIIQLVDTCLTRLKEFKKKLFPESGVSPSSTSTTAPQTESYDG